MSIGQKQRVGSLRFYLYGRSLHPELFEIHCDRRIVKSSYEAQIWVTGCTHVIGFFHEKQSLVEVAGDATMDLPKRGLLLDLPFRGEKNHEHQQANGIHYWMNFQAETMSPEVYAGTHHELARAGAKHGLFVPFPTWMSNGLTPFSYIDYQASPDSLHVFAFHAFPDDLTMLKTQSIFELC